MQLFLFTTEETVELDFDLVRKAGIKYPIVLPFPVWERYIKQSDVSSFKMDEQDRTSAILKGLGKIISLYNSFSVHPFIVFLEVDVASENWPNEMDGRERFMRQVCFKSKLINDHKREKTVVLIEPHIC